MEENAIYKGDILESEAEEFIYDYLWRSNISFYYQEKIEGLKGDNKIYRVADFYIPRLNLYIEFLGKWNSSELSKQGYREKKTLYKNNM